MHSYHRVVQLPQRFFCCASGSMSFPFALGRIMFLLLYCFVLSVTDSRPGGLVVTLECYYRVGQWVRIPLQVLRLMIYLQKKRRINCWERLSWVSTVRHESTREERAEIFSRSNRKARTVVGRGEEEPAMWPRIWVTTGREKEKGEENRWDETKK